MVCTKFYITLQDHFFSRKQLEGESLQDYYHAIYALMEKVIQKAPVGSVTTSCLTNMAWTSLISLW